MQHAQHIQRELRAKYGHMMIQWYEMINWSEPLILGIIALHITLFMTVFLTRHRLYLQFALFVLNIVLLVITEELNKWARAHWQLIATQQYFDKRGVFMSIFYAGPLLGLGFFQLILSLKTMAHMIIVVKSAEFRKQLQSKPNGEKCHTE